MSASDDTFFLDPDYADDISTIKLRTVAGESGTEFIIVFTLCAIVFGALVIGFLSTESWHRRFMADGVETTFTMMSCYTTSSSGKNGTTYTAHMTLRYEASGVELTGTSNLRGQCERYSSQMSGMYLASDPYTFDLMSRAQVERPFFIRQEGFFWGFIIALLSGGFGLYYVRKYILGTRKRARLYESGQVIHGAVLAARSDYRGKGQAHYVVVDYSFRTPAGTVLNGKQDLHREDLKPPSRGWFGGWFSGQKEKRKTEDISYLPTPHTPVQVLYADDENFVLL